MKLSERHQLAARSLAIEINRELFKQFPDCNFYKSRMYVECLSKFLVTLTNIADGRHRVYTNTLTPDELPEFRHVATDLYYLLRCFLAASGAETQTQVEERHSADERAVIDEVLCTFLKRQSPRFAYIYRNDI